MLKVGDKVKVVRKCSDDSRYPYWVPKKKGGKAIANMDDTLNNYYTVINIDKTYHITESLSITAYKLNTFPVTDYQYWYAAESLQKVGEQLYLPGMEILANEN